MNRSLAERLGVAEWGMPQTLRRMGLAMVRLNGAGVLHGQEEMVGLPTLFIAGDSTPARYGEGTMQG